MVRAFPELSVSANPKKKNYNNIVNKDKA